ncbi:Yhr138c-like protein [Neofusicoccum parvum]|uniref:Inhibitor I9 domain-containing protein n=2 Tax=Neofusicoccum parvum TaxID=310453 RepID=R1FV67_BOTPV|nr:hypothetical protein UCRNP2_10337 [Neofusicoccum parvum UCRNP2]GME26983.1 Yhr138c-like protein [Neofusicoccum parvum]GME56816.1 Yhr138c-like protein [Neofusicoccum parvum]
MKFFLVSLLFALLAACALGFESPKKKVIVSSEDKGVVDHAMQWIEDQEGVILHKYTLINAFLASAPASVFESAKNTFTTNNWGNLVMEEDAEVHAWSGEQN